MQFFKNLIKSIRIHIQKMKQTLAKINSSKLKCCFDNLCLITKKKFEI